MAATKRVLYVGEWGRGLRAPRGASGAVTLCAAGGLAEEVDEKVLHAAFIPFGDITDIQIPLDYETGAWRGAGRRRAVSRALTAGCVRREAPRFRLRGVRAGGGERRSKAALRDGGRAAGAACSREICPRQRAAALLLSRSADAEAAAPTLCAQAFFFKGREKWL